MTHTHGPLVWNVEHCTDVIPKPLFVLSRYQNYGYLKLWERTPPLIPGQGNASINPFQWPLLVCPLWFRTSMPITDTMKEYLLLPVPMFSN